MKLAIDLRKYCQQATLQESLSMYKSQRLAGLVCGQMADGSWVVKGKCLDSFNFVNHPWVKTDTMGSTLLDFGCDCDKIRQRNGMCPHCAILCLRSMEEIPEQILAPVAPIENRPATVKYTEPAAKEPAPVLPQKPTPVVSPEIVVEPQVQTPPVKEPEVKEIRSMEILFGKDSKGDSVIWYPNDTEKLFHSNMGIIGTMGTGKTQFAKSLLTQLYRNEHDNYDGHPLSILIFDYKGDYNETKRDFVDATRARVLKPYKLPYNPLALNPGKSFKPLLPTHTANEFKDTISQIYNLGPKQQHMLLNAILSAYRQQGIDPAIPATWSRCAPTIEQVYRILAEEMEGRPVDKLMTAIEKLHQFCLFEDNPRKAISLDELLRGVVVIDISGYDSDIQSTVVAITLNQFYARMQAQGSSPTDGRYRQLRKFIMVDEADAFMGEDISSLRRIMKEGREFGVGVILSTQSLEHYVGNEDDYSRYVLTWVVHNVGDLSQRDVEYLFRLQAKSQEGIHCYAAIKRLQKHESVVKMGNNEPVAIRNKAFFELYQQLQD